VYLCYKRDTREVLALKRMRKRDYLLKNEVPSLHWLYLYMYLALSSLQAPRVRLERDILVHAPVTSLCMQAALTTAGGRVRVAVDGAAALQLPGRQVPLPRHGTLSPPHLPLSIFLSISKS
jgi:hypothetical protein